MEGGQADFSCPSSAWKLQSWSTSKAIEDMGDGASVIPRWNTRYSPVALPETPEALGPWGLEVEGGGWVEKARD